MFRSVRALRSALLITAAATIFGCDRQNGDSSADSALARDLTLAGQTVAEPTLTDVAEAPPPVETPPVRTEPRSVPQRAPQRTAQQTIPAPAQTAPPPVEAEPVPAPVAAPTTGAIAAGTTLTLVTSMKVCTKTNLVGDKLTAAVRGAPQGTNGVTLPDGSTAVLEIASIGAGQSPEETSITFRVRAIAKDGTSRVAMGEGTVNEQLEKTEIGVQKGMDKKKVIGGAVAGAVLGQILGKDTKATVIGAAAGAAAGTIAAQKSRKYEGCLPSGATVKITLTEPLVLPIAT